VEFRILGPLQVCGAVRRLAIPPTGRRATLLAALLVHRNQVVPNYRLIEWIWGEGPPESAAASLHAHISRLRTALEQGSGSGVELLTRSPGYELSVPSESLDAVCFERGAQAGRALLISDPAGAASTLHEALALWRGRALDGFEEEPFARPESVRLEELRLVALEDLMEAELALGREATIIAELQSLVANHPTRERLIAQLVRALYHAGRQAEALAACSALRSRLVEELGIEPSPRLRQLERAVLRQEVADRPSGASTRPQQVGGESLPARAVPLPPFLTEIGRIFVGRDAELERLRRLWTEASAGGLRVVLLAGEPGVGKTRLAAELAARLHDQGATVLAGRCDEDLGVPYQPFVEALRHVIAHTPAEDLSRRLGRYAGELGRLVPELTERLPSLPPPLRSDPETERFRLFGAVAAWLAATSAEAPLLLVLDDLQWAAKPTLLLLRHVLQSPEPMRLLAVVTYRDTELGRTPPLSELLADLRRQTRMERISLSGLAAAAVAAFLEQAAGHELGPERDELAEAIHLETEGNAFFVREVVRHLIETGGLRQQGGRWVTGRPVEELGIPEGVRDVVGRRLTRLSETANGALAVAAVVGQEFGLAVLERAGRFDEEALVVALDEALAARLVAEVPGRASRYCFAHALVRATLYEELTGARRVILHRRVAEAIETVHAGRLDDHLPALAHHYARASAPREETGKAVVYATRAGDRALAQLAHDEAASYYRQALDLLAIAEGPQDDGQRLELLIALGEAQRRGGNPVYRRTLLDAAELAGHRGDSEALARAALANSPVLLLRGVGQVDSDRIAMIERALEAVGKRGTAMRARLLASLGLELLWAGDRGRRVALSGEALAIARRLGDPAVLADVLLARFYTISGPTTLAERLAETAELLAVAEQLDDRVVRSRGLVPRLRAAMEIGDVEEAQRCLEANERLAADLGLPALRWVVTLHQAGRALLAGQIAAAEAGVSDIRDLGRAAGEPDAPGQSIVLLFQIRFEQGRLAEVEEAFVEAVREFPIPALRGLLAVLYCELDRRDEGRLVFDELAVSGFPFPSDVIWLRGMTECAVACAQLGDTARATQLYDLLAPYPDQFVTTLYGGLISGSVAHYLGLLTTTLGRFEAAQGYFAKAADAHERIGAPTWLARTRLEWARMLVSRRRRGDVEMARGLLLQSLSTARELGLANVERRAVALLS
jgi:DNA-binding SARP family transcriptional activator/tetratricopeptide (TPR) repeat protein